MKIFSLLIISSVLSLPLIAKDLVIYSSRKEQLLKPILDAYTKETGTKFQVKTDGDGALIERLRAEGLKTPADVLITVDAGNLWQADQNDLLAAVESEILNNKIPAHLREPEGHWFGFSVRARTIFYNPTTVKASDLSTYENLADPKWKGKLCLRTSKKVYNQSLVASLIKRHGEKKAQEIVEGWVANLATDVFPNDTAMLKAIDAGQCQVGIANTYYFGRLQKEEPKLKVNIFWPNQKTAGVHVNVSGAAVVKASKNKEEATKFLEWLADGTAQQIFASSNMEYPANAAVPTDKAVLAWGSFKQDLMNLESVGELQATAVKLMDRAKYR